MYIHMYYICMTYIFCLRHPNFELNFDETDIFVTDNVKFKVGNKLEFDCCVSYVSFKKKEINLKKKLFWNKTMTVSLWCAYSLGYLMKFTKIILFELYPHTPSPSHLFISEWRRVDKSERAVHRNVPDVWEDNPRHADTSKLGSLKRWETVGPIQKNNSWVNFLSRRWPIDSRIKSYLLTLQSTGVSYH